jgi:hypothetical protein
MLPLFIEYKQETKIISFRLVKCQVLLIRRYQQLPLVYSFVMLGIGMIADGYTHVHLSLFSSLEFGIIKMILYLGS